MTNEDIEAAIAMIDDKAPEEIPVTVGPPGVSANGDLLLMSVMQAGRRSRVEGVPRVSPYRDDRWTECWLHGWDTPEPLYEKRLARQGALEAENAELSANADTHAHEVIDHFVKRNRQLEQGGLKFAEFCRERIAEQSYVMAAKDARIAELEQAVTGELGPALLKCRRERDDAVARTFILRDACDRNEQTIAAKDARIAELDTELAQLRRAACDDPNKEPGVVPTGLPGVSLRKISQYDVAGKAPIEKPNPFRDFPSDPRRMGP